MLAEKRFYNALVTNLKTFANPVGSDKIDELGFCKLMCVFDESKILYPTDMEFDQFLERLFYRIRNTSTN